MGTTKRIAKKKRLLYRARMLRDYVLGVRRTYKYWQLRDLRRMNLPKTKALSLNKASRLIREQDRAERDEMIGLITALSEGETSGD